MNVNYLKVSLPHKAYCFIRTESRFFEISESQCTDGLILDAIPVPTSAVADLLAQAEKLQQKKARGKASRIRGLRKEEAV